MEILKNSWVVLEVEELKRVRTLSFFSNQSTLVIQANSFTQCVIFSLFYISLKH